MIDCATLREAFYFILCRPSKGTTNRPQPTCAKRNGPRAMVILSCFTVLGQQPRGRLPPPPQRNWLKNIGHSGQCSPSNNHGRRLLLLLLLCKTGGSSALELVAPPSASFTREPAEAILGLVIWRASSQNSKRGDRRHFLLQHGVCSSSTAAASSSSMAPPLTKQSPGAILALASGHALANVAMPH